MDFILEEDKMIEEDTLKDKYLFFSIDKEVYGLEIKYVTEIIGIQEITHVPQLPSFMKGIINLRGSVIPVADLRIRFQKETKAYSSRTSIIIVSYEEVTLGLIVDKAIEVGTILPEEVLPPPEIASGYHDRFVKGIHKNDNAIRLLLDCEKLVSKDEMLEIEQAIY